ncbi:hypothetical protein PYCC9005_005142 [Savitreella phatthalungensis]
MSRVNKRKAGHDIDEASATDGLQHKKLKAGSRPTAKRNTHSDEEDDAGFAFVRPVQASRPVVGPAAKQIGTHSATTATTTTAASTKVAAPVPAKRVSPRLHRTMDNGPRLPSMPAATPRDTGRIGRKLETENMASGSDSFVALPLSDTPIIRKNQQLRRDMAAGGSAQQETGKRRSSLGMRGRRASSMGNGLASQPHADVPAGEFYKHISVDLPDPVRMKQLLTWCAQRVIDENKARKTDDTGAGTGAGGKAAAGDKIQVAAIARLIEEEVLKDLLDNKITTSWYQRPDDQQQQQQLVEKKPHPKNTANAEKLEELRQKLAALKDEEAVWERLLKEHTSEIPEEPVALEAPSAASIPAERFAKSTTNQVQTSSIEDIDLDLLPAGEAEFMHQLSLRRWQEGVNAVASGDMSGGSGAGEASSFDNDWLMNAEKELEFKVDSLLHSLHAVEQVVRQADRDSSNVLSTAAKAIAEAEQQARAESRSQGVGTMDILRQIARRG